MLKVTVGNVDDREPVHELAKDITGSLYCDIGSIVKLVITPVPSISALSYFFPNPANGRLPVYVHWYIPMRN
ncbi:transposase [Xenorhabdus ishibashii]|uniref:Transposase n=1 Tax=Xenorhabdus ishibashii TaxID=1034471 RepID=A0A2D0KGM5_9GAMM|nr:transposase [Xenorhabdus ishibashii]